MNNIDRNEKLTIRISKEEMEMIQSEADSVGISVSDYIRMRALRFGLKFYKEFFIEDYSLSKSKKKMKGIRVK